MRSFEEELVGEILEGGTWPLNMSRAFRRRSNVRGHLIHVIDRKTKARRHVYDYWEKQYRWKCTNTHSLMYVLDSGVPSPQ